MTTAEMLTSYRFRMEDPDGNKWDTDSLTEVYRFFTLGQRMAIDFLIESRQFVFLQELQTSQSYAFTSSVKTKPLPSDHYRTVAIINSSGDPIQFFEVPPDDFIRDTDYLRPDDIKEYFYIFANSLRLRGSIHSSGAYTQFYIKQPSNIDGSTNPATSDKVQELTLMISTWIAWGIDRQFDRQNQVAQLIKSIFGIDVNGSVPRS